VFGFFDALKKKKIAVGVQPLMVRRSNNKKTPHDSNSSSMYATYGKVVLPAYQELSRSTRRCVPPTNTTHHYQLQVTQSKKNKEGQVLLFIAQ
jgi:hypothetical protein